MKTLYCLAFTLVILVTWTKSAPDPLDTININFNEKSSSPYYSPGFESDDAAEDKEIEIGTTPRSYVLCVTRVRDVLCIPEHKPDDCPDATWAKMKDPTNIKYCSFIKKDPCKALHLKCGRVCNLEAFPEHWKYCQPDGSCAEHAPEASEECKGHKFWYDSALAWKARR